MLLRLGLELSFEGIDIQIVFVIGIGDIGHSPSSFEIICSR